MAFKVYPKNHIDTVLEEISSGRFFSVTFIKRSNGKSRTLNCRTGVHKYINSIVYDVNKKNLLTVWDPSAHIKTKNGYRSIPKDGITKIVASGNEWNFV